MVFEGNDQLLVLVARSAWCTRVFVHCLRKRWTTVKTVPLLKSNRMGCMVYMAMFPSMLQSIGQSHDFHLHTKIEGVSVDSWNAAQVPLMKGFQ